MILESRLEEWRCRAPRRKPHVRILSGPMGRQWRETAKESTERIVRNESAGPVAHFAEAVERTRGQCFESNFPRGRKLNGNAGAGPPER